jgi:DNA-binding transcriptional ArsR family regulator
MNRTLVGSPSCEDYRAKETDKVFKALADPSRRQLLDRLHFQSGQTLSELCQGLDMTRQAVTQHLALLEEANLVAVQWRGREKLHYFNPVPIHEIYERWIRKFERQRLRALHDLKRKLERKKS